MHKYIDHCCIVRWSCHDLSSFANARYLRQVIYGRPDAQN